VILRWKPHSLAREEAANGKALRRCTLVSYLACGSIDYVSSSASEAVFARAWFELIFADLAALVTYCGR